MVNGTRFLLLVNTGTEQSPTLETIAYQRDASIDEASETIDFSSKEQREQRVGAGRYTSTVTLDALFVPNQASYQTLVAHNRAGTLVMIAKELDGVIYEAAMCKIDSLSEAFPDQEAATISISLTVDGAWEQQGS